MQQSFYVAHDGEQSGPFSLDEIWTRIESRQLDLNDYIYDESSQDWVMLMAYPALSERVKNFKPAEVPKAASAATEPAQESKSTEWFVLKGDHKFGPFGLPELVKLLQDKSVFEFDYVWHKGLTSWQRIAELADFKPEKIREMKNGGLTHVNEVFFRRRHVRVSHAASLLVHDSKTLWKGQSFEISEGGAGIVIENALIQPGHNVYLHFKPGDEMPPFNAHCEVVSKQFIKVEDRKSPVRYGVKFLKLDTNAEKAVKNLTKPKKAA